LGKSLPLKRNSQIVGFVKYFVEKPGCTPASSKSQILCAQFSFRNTNKIIRKILYRREAEGRRQEAGGRKYIFALCHRV
jgi:hypothetical protein